MVGLTIGALATVAATIAALITQGISLGVFALLGIGGGGSSTNLLSSGFRFGISLLVSLIVTIIGGLIFGTIFGCLGSYLALDRHRQPEAILLTRKDATGGPETQRTRERTVIGSCRGRERISTPFPTAPGLSSLLLLVGRFFPPVPLCVSVPPVASLTVPISTPPDAAPATAHPARPRAPLAARATHPTDAR